MSQIALALCLGALTRKAAWREGLHDAGAAADGMATLSAADQADIAALLDDARRKRNSTGGAPSHHLSYAEGSRVMRLIPHICIAQLSAACSPTFPDLNKVCGEHLDCSAAYALLSHKLRTSGVLVLSGAYIPPCVLHRWQSTLLTPNSQQHCAPSQEPAFIYVASPSHQRTSSGG